MSKKVKVLTSVLVAVVLLAAAGTTVVMAADEPSPSAEASTANITSRNSLLARVAEKLGVIEEQLVTAFREAQQEMRGEAFTRALDRAVEKGRITEEEAGEIKEWWEQRPEILDSGPFQHAFGAPALPGRHMRAHGANVTGEISITPGIAEQFKLRWQNRINTNNCPVPRLQIAKAIRGRQQIAVPKGWRGPRTPELAD